MLRAVAIDEPGKHDRGFRPIDIRGLDPHALQSSLKVADIGSNDLQDRVGRSRHRRRGVDLWDLDEGATQVLRCHRAFAV